MSELDRQTFECILKPHPGIKADNIWKAETNCTEQGIRPGVPLPGQVTQMAMSANGTMPSDSDIRVQLVRAGMPGVNGAQIAWKRTSDADFYGCNIPNELNGVQPLRTWTSARNEYDPDAISFDDGTVLTVLHEETVTNDRVVAIYRDSDKLWPADGGASSAVSVYNPSKVVSIPLAPCLVKTPGDVALCFHVTEESEDVYGTVSNVWCWSSKDRGQSWSLVAKDILPQTINHSTWDLSTIRLRGAYNAGQLLILMTLQYPTGTGAPKNYMTVVRQYASTSGGASLDLVYEWDGEIGDGGGGFFDVEVFQGRFHISMIQQSQDTAGETKLMHTSVGSAYENILHAAWSELDSSIAGWATATQDSGSQYYLAARGGDTALCNYAGRLWLFTRVQGDSNKRHPVFYTEDGETWEGAAAVSDQNETWFTPKSSNAYMAMFSAVSHRGRVGIVTSFETPSGSPSPTYDRQLLFCTLGGWTNVPMPRHISYGTPGPRSRAYFTSHWCAIHFPQAMGWTAVGAGSEALQTDCSLKVDTSAASQQRLYRQTPSYDVDRGAIILIRGHYSSGSTTASNPRVGFQIRLATGSTSYGVDCSIQGGPAAAATVGDLNSGNTFATTSIDGDYTFELLVALVGDSGGGAGVVHVWARQVETASVSGRDNEVRRWTESGTFALTDGGASTDLLEWAHVSGTEIDALTSYWHEIKTCNEATALSAPHLSGGLATPDDLYGQVTGPEAVDLLDGLKVSQTSGPGFATEYWDIAREYDYGADKLLPTDEIRPSVNWRSESETANQTIAWELNPGIAENSMLSEVIGVWGQSNMKSVDVDVYTQGAGWSSFLTLDFSAGLTGLAYNRSGTVVRPAASAAGSRWIHHNELAGGTFNFGSGLLRRITSNTSGWWGDPATSKRVRLSLEGILGTEPASGSGEIWAPQAHAYRHITDSAGGAQYRGFRVDITGGVNTTIHGHHRLKLVIGDVQPLGWRPSEGAVERLEPNLDVTDYRGGGRTVVKLGEIRRTLTLAWTEPIPQHEIWKGSADVEWFSNYPGGSGYPWGSRYETPGLIKGLLEELDGMVTPVVVFPYVQARSGAVVSYNSNRPIVFLAQLVGPVEVTNQVTKQLRRAEAVSVAVVRFDEVKG